MSSNNNVSDFIKNTMEDIKEMSTLNQIAIGGTAGLVTGYVMSRVGKIAAFTVGSGLIALQVAQHLGYIEVKWGKKSSKLKDLKKKAIKAAEQSGLIEGQSSSEKMEKTFGQVKNFFQENFTFGVSFGGGILVGFSI